MSQISDNVIFAGDVVTLKLNTDRRFVVKYFFTKGNTNKIYRAGPSDEALLTKLSWLDENLVESTSIVPFEHLKLVERG